jgi:hypothetical protein
MSSATAQRTSERNARSRHRRHRPSLTRIKPATWRKIGVYALVYTIAVIVCWKL